jgi:FMNH2-dependent dimethyl sulfone monooxygenase
MDFHFAVADRVEVLAERVADMRSRAAQRDRTVDIFTPLFIVARDTESEARAVVAEIVDQTDRVCVDNVLRVMNVPVGGGSGRLQEFGYSRWNRGTLEERLIVGWMQPLLIGTPEQVAEQLAEYASAGIRGVMLDWYDFDAELEYFGDRILPLLEEMGLRHTVSAVAT